MMNGAYVVKQNYNNCIKRRLSENTANKIIYIQIGVSKCKGNRCTFYSTTVRLYLVTRCLPRVSQRKDLKRKTECRRHRKSPNVYCTVYNNISGRRRGVGSLSLVHWSDSLQTRSKGVILLRRHVAFPCKINPRTDPFPHVAIFSPTQDWPS
jgi:hypothetical protein